MCMLGLFIYTYLNSSPMAPLLLLHVFILILNVVLLLSFYSSGYRTTCGFETLFNHHCTTRVQ